MKPLDQIPTNHTPQSVPEAVFIEYRQGRLDYRQYLAGNAIWVAENTRKYPVTPYTPCPPGLKEYIRARIGGARDRDPGMHYRLGQWAWSVMRVMNDNVANFELLVWARTLCEAEGMKTNVEAIDRRLEQYVGANPPQEFPEALEAQKRDSADKQRGAA